jgi:hypothetical protein
MALNKMFGTNESLETKGIVIDYGDTRIRIARAGGSNKKFAKAISVATKPFRRAIAADAMDPEKALDIMRSVYAQTVILDWETKVKGEFKKGIDPVDAGKPDGDLLPPTVDNIEAVLKHLPDLFSDLQNQSQSLALFRAEVDEALLGK